MKDIRDIYQEIAEQRAELVLAGDLLHASDDAGRPRPEARPERARGERDEVLPWWREAVFYQIYIRSFADGNGDGDDPR